VVEQEQRERRKTAAWPQIWIFAVTAKNHDGKTSTNPTLVPFPVLFVTFHSTSMYRALATSTIKASKQSLASARPSALLVKHTPNTTSVRHSSILKAFVDTIKDQVKKNKDLQQGVKSLQDESGKVYDSEALKKARELYEKAKVMAQPHNLESAALGCY
jgi:hypothetical protein